VAAPIRRALRDADVAPERIDEVLLVGGSTRMPCIARLATDVFGRLPLRVLPPDEAVALGAAVQAGLKANDAALGDLVVTDIAPFSLGIDIARRSGDEMVSGLFSPIIERGTLIPVSRERTYHTIEDGQRQLEVNVYQGEHSLVRDNTRLGSYTIRGLAPKPAGEQAIRVRLTYDLNGILEVDMTVESTGKTETLVIERGANRLSPRELRDARKAMARLKFHPRDALPNATLLARADALYVALTGPPRAVLARAIEQFRIALEHQDDALIAPRASTSARWSRSCDRSPAGSAWRCQVHRLAILSRLAQ